jgi:4-hydroxybenzoate polyprenyltransferase
MDAKGPTAYIYLKRGSGYSLISLFSILSGYIMTRHNLSDISKEDIILLLIVYLISLLFFIPYAILFHYEKSKDSTPLDNEPYYAIKLTLFLVVPIGLILFYNNHLINTSLLLFILLFFVIYISYGAYFIYCAVTDKKLTMRHQLIWPTILTIAFPLYFGYFFKTIIDIKEFSLAIYLPILLVMLFFALSFFQKKKIFILFNLSGIILTTLLISLQYFIVFNIMPESLFNYLIAMVFCLIVSGYLAVFEAWWITYHVSIKGLSENNNDIIYLTSLESSFQYRMATTLGLIISAVFIPIAFIFSGYGLVFIYIFLVHCIAAFWRWSYSVTKNISKLTELNWLSWKLWFGFVFLLLLIVDSPIIYNRQPSVLLLRKFMENFISIFGGIGGIIGLTVIIRKYIDRRSLRGIAENQRLVYLFSDINVQLWIIIILSSVVYLFLLILMEEATNPVLVIRTTHACLVYFILMIISILFIVIDSFFQGIFFRSIFKSIFTFLVGLLQLTRIITSLLLGLIIFIPSYINGNNGLISLSIASPFILCLLGGFALNDVFDIEKDMINKPHRAIPSNKISYRQGLLISFTLITISILVSFIVCKTIFELFIYLISIIGIISYNYLLRKYPLIKNLFAAILCSLPILFILDSFNYSIDYYLLLISTIIFIFGRELLMDTKDIEGDKSTGIFTIPYYLGKKLSVKISFTAIALSNIILISLSIIKNNYKYLIIMIVSLTFVFLASRIWIVGLGKYQGRIILSLWLPMLCGLSILII